MNFFKKLSPSPRFIFSPDEWTPVIRSSICTGEKSACMQNNETGKILELKLLRNAAEVEDFCKEYGTSSDKIKTIY